MLTGHYKKKTKKSFQKRLVKGTKIFLKKKKRKSTNMLVSDIEISLKKKETKRRYGRERYKKLLQEGKQKVS